MVYASQPVSDIVRRYIMVKLYIENLDQESDVSVRIYRLDKTELNMPDSFTPMDSVGGSYAINLLPHVPEEFECVGVMNTAGGIEIEGAGDITIKVGGEEFKATNRNMVADTFIDAGVDATLLNSFERDAVHCETDKSDTVVIPSTIYANDDIEISLDGISLGIFRFDPYNIRNNESVRQALADQGILIEFIEEQS